jgi:tRNA-2-methylthio-N6-dimethylallyladenosine synthase
MPFLHLPVQAGSDRVLRAMNRSHTAEAISPYSTRSAPRGTTSRCRAISSSVSRAKPSRVRGHAALVEAVGYAQCFSFKYSPRPGTPAATMEGQVPMAVMDERLQRLQAALNRDHSSPSTGPRKASAATVLVERKGKHRGQWLGKSPWLQSVHFTGDAAIGDLVEVELVEAGAELARGSPGRGGEIIPGPRRGPRLLSGGGALSSESGPRPAR